MRARAESEATSSPSRLAISNGFASGTAVVQRFDGRGTVEVFYVTFTTKTAGMPFMATVIAPVAS